MLRGEVTEMMRRVGEVFNEVPATRFRNDSGDGGI